MHGRFPLFCSELRERGPSQGIAVALQLYTSQRGTTPWFPSSRSLIVRIKLSLRNSPAALQVCTTLGMLTPEQAKQLREAGLTAYNHNLDTSPEYYSRITSSRKYEVTCRVWPHEECL